MATRALTKPLRPASSGEGFDFSQTVAGELAVSEEESASATRTLREYLELMPEPGVGPMSMDDFPFQEEWYSEEVARAPEVVFPKGAQVGASAMGIRWAVQQVDQFGDIGLYVMPTLDDVFEFGDERIEPAIEESDYLKRRIRGKFVRNKRLKRIGRGFLHMRGSNSKSGAQSVPATFLVLDEMDLLDQTNVPHILRRVSGAVQRGKVPKIRRLGYPLLPNHGIDLAWQESDQRVWHVTCRCGCEQPITWEENLRWTMPGVLEEKPAKKGAKRKPKVLRPGRDEFEPGKRKVIGDVWRQCRECARSLEDSSPAKKDGALRKGRWIPQNPGADVIGFQVWRGMVPVTDLAQLVIASRGRTDAEKEAFAALDLGRPHTTGESSLDDNDLTRACAMGIPMVNRAHRFRSSNPTTMGVDVAGERALNVQIDEQLPGDGGGPNPRRTVWAGEVETFEEVARLIDRFRCVMVAIDSNPERKAARAIRRLFPGRVALVEYETNYFAEPMKITQDDAGVLLKVRVHRTDAIDGMMESVRSTLWRPPVDPPPGWRAQMKALVRRTELDTKERPVRTYVTTGTDGDDYAHAAAYALVATELWRVTGMAAQRMAEQSGQQLTEHELAFKRVRLSGDDPDYRPGFGLGV